MFEEIFKDEIIAKQNKIIQETIQATKDYSLAKESNPSMLTTNGSIGLSPLMNYTGYYNNPYANPNLIPPPPTFSNNYYNPYVYNRPLYGNGTWYGGGGYYNTSYDYTSKFMIASDDEIRSGINTRGRVIVDDTNTIDVETEQEHVSYEDKVTGKNLQVIVEEEEITVEETQDPKIRELDGIKFIEEKLDLSKHPPNTPFTIDELKQNTIRILVNTPLIWTEEDEAELSKLVDMIAVYDKALAHIMWNIPCNTQNISREDYNYCKMYCRNLIQYYRSEEIMHNEIDFKAPYRHRELPKLCEDKSPDISQPYPYAKLEYSEVFDNMVYVYDRGRDQLTEYEWNIFCDRAYFELMDGIKTLRGNDLLKINKPLLEDNTSKNQYTHNNEPNYNPYDPISVKLYNMKQYEKNYNTNMEFFRYALRYKFASDDQFDNWWYGTKSQADFIKNQKDPNFYRSHQESSWKRQMTEQNITNLGRFVPLDHNVIAQEYNKRAQQEINNYTKGNITSNMSMTDVMNNLPYLDNRIHEMTVEQNFANYKNSLVYNNGQSIVNKNMFNHMLYEFHNNDNPNYLSPYGPTIDPRMGVPDVIHDYTQDAQNSYNERLQRFLNACNQMKEFPLNSAGGTR